MKNFLQKILGKEIKNSTENIIKSCNVKPDLHKNLPIQSNCLDYCKSCSIQMCNICADSHISNSCHVKTNTNKNLGTQSLLSFNLGYLTKADLRNLKCICGKQLNHKSAMCAACGLASCSQNCHKQWQKQGNCTFSNNFQNVPQNFTMRSILFQNIQNIRKANIKRWNPANRSNINMITCYASIQPNYVYFQRGFRNYGNPQKQLIQRFQIIPKNIDYTTHIDRICNCTCYSCSSSQKHSNQNCYFSCSQQKGHFLQTFALNPKNHYQCNCTCQFCQSGIIIDTHRIIDCYFQCYKKQLRQY